MIYMYILCIYIELSYSVAILLAAILHFAVKSSDLWVEGSKTAHDSVVRKALYCLIKHSRQLPQPQNR